MCGVGARLVQQEGRIYALGNGGTLCPRHSQFLKMLPVIALVGRPNVGKSTLFNKLTRTRDAPVASYPGLTRDRQYGKGSIDDFHFLVIDTGGIAGSQQAIDASLVSQVKSHW